MNSFNPELQPKDTESAIKHELIDLLTNEEAFTCDNTNFRVSRKYEVMIKQNMTQLIKMTLIMYLNQSILQLHQKYKKYFGKDSGCITDSVMDANINISKHNPLGCSSYIKLPKELNHLRKCLINIRNIDESECFGRCLVRY